MNFTLVYKTYLQYHNIKISLLPSRLCVVLHSRIYTAFIKRKLVRIN